jgi:NADPH:quinone reductase-like Zn-dependent oxidoreductase
MRPDLETTQDASGVIDAPGMQAVVRDRYGDADVVEIRTVDRPTISATQVLVQVEAAGIDRGVWHLMTGEPYAVRLVIGLSKPKQPVLGLDVSGRVVAVGAEVTRFQPGDEVFGIANGSFAQYAVAEETKLVPKPSSVSWEQAGVAAISGGTALQALTDVGEVQAGQRVLVIGASGGVGTYAVQLAKALGADVTGVCSSAKVDLVRTIGADHVIDYTREDYLDGATTYDLILDIGGRNSVTRLRHALTATGTLVIVGGEDGGRVTGGIGRQIRAMLVSPFIRQNLKSFIQKEHHTTIERLAEHLASGAVVPVIGRTVGLPGVPDAIRDLEAGRVGGKIAVSVPKQD